ncbi:MAG: hypothetical protein II348_04935, partial [Clostridia bacterium]|nr:hypothetical protein [Clostridia bacterium]
IVMDAEEVDFDEDLLEKSSKRIFAKRTSKGLEDLFDDEDPKKKKKETKKKKKLFFRDEDEDDDDDFFDDDED